MVSSLLIVLLEDLAPYMVNGGLMLGWGVRGEPGITPLEEEK
ncbi:hypothetical protein [Alicyclobacillus dauci]|uniref:Uncharacterized protein n=1 Tax=Alicyclobacillus dauci TaxID=1475485 RepID=A0ABY6Z0F3_9BACL|nr:hypothetical protein [Alicyclobacillus dauci]WAH35711.1 hypothetical protein NZD86_15700 [Alicyclobacillus dauci]